MSFSFSSLRRLRPPLLLAMASVGAEIVILVDGGGGPLIAHVVLVGIATVATCFMAVTAKERIGSAAVWTYAAFFGLFVASSVASITPTYGLSELLMFAAGGSLFCIVSATTASQREYVITWYGRGLATLGLLEALYGAWEYVSSPVQRLSGTFLDVASARTSFANNFADFLLLCIPLLGVWVWRSTRVRSQALSILAMAFTVAAFVLTFSRAAWVSAGIMLVLSALWLVLFQRRTFFRQAWKFVVVGVMSVLLIGALQEAKAWRFETTPLLRKVTFSADEGGASASERWQYWRGAISIAQEHPWLGSGIQSFGVLFPAHQREFGIVEDHPHNVLLKIAVENGLPAALLFLAFLVLVGWRAAWSAWRDPAHPALPFVVGSLAALGHNILDYNFNAANFPLVMIGLGLAYGMGRTTPLSSRTPAPRRGWVVLSGGMLAVCALMLHEVWYNIPFKLGREALTERRYEQAEMLLEKAKNLVFTRDLSHVLGRLYRDRGAPGDREKELAVIQEALLHSPLDAALIARRGEIEQAMGQIPNARASFEKAVEIDPMNRLRYFFLLLDWYGRNNTPKPTVLVTQARSLVQDYLPFLVRNAHYTVTGDNPIYAIRLAMLLDEKALAQKIQDVYDRQRSVFQQKTNLVVDPSPY